MIQIHSTGRPIVARDLRVGMTIIEDESVVKITHTRVVTEEHLDIVGETIFGHWQMFFHHDDIVNLAEEESLDDPATAMSLYLALREKGAM